MEEAQHEERSTALDQKAAAVDAGGIEASAHAAPS
jgi:hypothetical protein